MCVLVNITQYPQYAIKFWNIYTINQIIAYYFINTQFLVCEWTLNVLLLRQIDVKSLRISSYRTSKPAVAHTAQSSLLAQLIVRTHFSLMQHPVQNLPVITPGFEHAVAQVQLDSNLFIPSSSVNVILYLTCFRAIIPPLQ